jgi:hypothetical protein
MTAVPDTSLGRRTIGEILLGHGHVSKEQLDEATAIHLEAGRPLGQILVETGAITRLELASALAEQWSDSGAPIGPPGSLSGSVSTLGLPSDGVAPPAPPAPALDRELLSRVQRVEEVLDRLDTSEDERGEDRSQAALEELTERLALVEPAIDELGNRLEALATEDVGNQQRDERLDEHASLFGALSERLTAVGESAEAAARRTDELASDAVDALEALKDGLAAVSARFPELADAQEVEKLRELVDALSQRPLRDEELFEHVASLRDAVDALHERPTRDAELIVQVDTLATRISEVGDRVDVLAAAAQATPGDADALAELQEALAELARRPQADPQVERRLDDLASTLDELRASFDELAAKQAGDPELDQKLWQLTSRLEELEGSDALEDLRTRLVQLSDRPTVDPAVVQRLAELESRVDAVPGDDVLEELGDVRSRVTELSERPTVDPAIVQRLAELESRVDAVPGDDVLEALGAGDRSLGFRIDGVVARIDELAASLEQVGDSSVSRDAWDEAVALLNSRLEAEADLSGRLAQLEERLAQAGSNGGSGGAGSASGLETHVAALTARVEELAAEIASAPPRVTAEDGGAAQSAASSPALERDVEHVLMAIERLSVHLGAHERALTELMGAGGVVAQVRELAARVGDLETYGSASGDGSAVAGGGGDGEMRAELRSLMRRLEEAESAQKNDRERVIDQLEKAAGAIDWRLQRLEAVRSDDPSAT